MIDTFINLFSNELFLFVFFLFSIIILLCISELTYYINVKSNTFNRKIIHFIIGTSCSMTPYIFNKNHFPILLALIFLLINYISINNNKLKSLKISNIESYGTIYFPISYLFITIFFWNFPSHITISMLILAISDPIASLVGEKNNYNKSFNLYGDRKTYIGSSAMFISSFFISLMTTYYFFNWGLQFCLISSIFIALSSTISEFISYKGSDNLSIPIVTFLFVEMFCFIYKENSIIEFMVISLFIIFILYLTYLKKYLSISGFIGASLMATLIVGYGGINTLLIFITFFISSSILSHINKQDIYLKKSKRNINQVYSNGGVALTIFLISHFINNDIMPILILASIASANADTWGTELGKLSLKPPIDIISRKVIKKGMSGGITMVGTIGSMLGSMLIGFLGYFFHIEINAIIIIIIAGFSASIIDSIIGSTYQARFICPKSSAISEKKKLNHYLYTGNKNINNDVVNIICTAIAPITLLTYSYFF